MLPTDKSGYSVLSTDKNGCSAGANFCNLVLSQLHCSRKEGKRGKSNKLQRSAT